MGAETVESNWCQACVTEVSQACHYGLLNQEHKNLNME